MADGALWADSERARQTVTEVKALKGWLEPYHALRKRVDEGRELTELLEADSHIDLAMQRSLETEADEVAARLESLEMQNMLQGPDDMRDALLTIHPGAGGTESQDWAEMLVRMYSRWAERKGYKLEELDRQPGDEAGIKSATIGVEGEWAYGWLRAEAGVHRLVRISPFDANARRQTAFASVFVYPDIDETIKIEIDEKDLRIDKMRSGGAGGQHVNKTESAVRVTHLPTGIAVHSDGERSQHKNLSTAMRILKAKLFELEEKKREEKMGNIHAQKKAIEWGSQIRSYVLAPYRLVTDHRTGVKVGNVDVVLDGDLDQYMVAMLLELAGDPSAKPVTKPGDDDL